MKNNTKLIMETWRRFINEEIDDASLETGFEADDDSMPTEFDPEDGNYFDEESQGLDREDEYGFDSDPEDRDLKGDPVPVDPDMVDTRYQRPSDEEFYNISMGDESEHDLFLHGFDDEPDY